MDAPFTNADDSPEVVDFGPLQPLLQDETITDIVVDDYQTTFVERAGKLERVSALFRDRAHLLEIIQGIANSAGYSIDNNQPILNFHLSTGLRISMVVPPVAVNGPSLTIRKTAVSALSVEDLIGADFFSQEVVEFLRAAVIGGVNIIICGNPGAGKTTLLNTLANYCPANERIITIEKIHELQLNHPHVLALTLPQAASEGRGSITFAAMLDNALRMHPGRIIVSDALGEELLDVLDVMSTGPSGVMCTVNASSPRQALAGLEFAAARAGFSSSIRVLREKVTSSLGLIVQVALLRDRSRRVVWVTEVHGMESDLIVLTDLWVFEQTGFEISRIVGQLRPTGRRPKCIEQIEDAGVHVPPEVFGIGERPVEVRPVEIRPVKPMPGRIHILIATQVPETRTNIGKLFAFEPDFQVIGLCGSGEEMGQIIALSQPDVAVVKFPLPGLDHPEEVEVLNQGSSPIRVVAIVNDDTMPASWASLPRMTKAILLAPPPADGLIEAVRHAAENAEQSLVHLYGLARITTLAHYLNISEEAAHSTALALEQRGFIQLHTDAGGQTWLVTQSKAMASAELLEPKDRVRRGVAYELFDQIDGLQ